MECYFAVGTNNTKQLILDKEDTWHINKVLRHKINDEIVVVFQEKKYLVRIITLTPIVSCQIIKELAINSELPIKITLVMALLKEQKFDMIIQKAVELGVCFIVPIQLDHCISVVRTSDKMNNKIIRWQKIAKAAAKQSNRNIIPKIMPIVTKISDLKSYQSEVNFLAYENATVENWVSNLKGKKSVTVVVGPEGGISEKELESFFNGDFDSISLGRTILRAETAPLYFLSVVNYYSVFGQ
ncbi:MAG: RsmE family RNA methyltransferase [Spiroplasma sp.]